MFEHVVAYLPPHELLDNQYPTETGGEIRSGHYHKRFACGVSRISIDRFLLLTWEILTPILMGRPLIRVGFTVA